MFPERLKIHRNVLAVDRRGGKEEKKTNKDVVEKLGPVEWQRLREVICGWLYSLVSLKFKDDGWHSIWQRTLATIERQCQQNIKGGIKLDGSEGNGPSSSIIKLLLNTYNMPDVEAVKHFLCLVPSVFGDWQSHEHHYNLMQLILCCGNLETEQSTTFGTIGQTYWQNKEKWEEEEEEGRKTTKYRKQCGVLGVFLNSLQKHWIQVIMIC